MEISYGLVNLMYFMLCGELNRIKGSRSNKRRKLLTCFTNSLFKVYNNLSLRETRPEVYNTTKWVDYVEEPKKFQALRPHFFSVGGGLEGSRGEWVGGGGVVDGVGWVGVWWWGGWGWWW